MTETTTITLTIPATTLAIIDRHMKKTGRKNRSAFFADCVQQMITYELKDKGQPVPKFPQRRGRGGDHRKTAAKRNPIKTKGTK